MITKGIFVGLKRGIRLGFVEKCGNSDLNFISFSGRCREFVHLDAILEIRQVIG